MTPNPPDAASSRARFASPSSNITHLPGVDHLRGAAALLMVLYHGYQQLGDRVFVRADHPLEAVLIEGHTAVALFMVLSGFIFTTGTLDRDIRYASFVRNRVLRIMPMYALVVLLAVYTSPEGYDLGGLVQLFTLQGTPPIASADLGPFGALLWTISVEFAFYLVFPFLVRFLRNNGPLYLVGLVATMVALRLLAAGVDPDGVRDLSYWTIVGRLDQFVAGMLIGWLLVRRPRWWSPAVAAALMVAGLLAAVVMLEWFNRNGSWYDTAVWKTVWPTVEGAVWAGVVLGYVVLAQRLPARTARVLALPGIVSYSAYLLHYAIVVALIDREPVGFAGTGAANALVNTAVVIVPATFALATLTYLVVERPFMQLRRRYIA